jgi:dipeptidyl aminopeptidase/acylaminoacyl peptidase
MHSGRMRGSLILLALAAILFIAGCQKGEPAKLSLEKAPAIATGRTVEPGIAFQEVSVPRKDGGTSKLWVYLPEPRPKGNLPCVLIAPAGTPLIYGNELGNFGDGSEPEHLPYVRAGFAVVAYEIDGPVRSEKPSDEEVVRAAKEFKAADAGVANTRATVDYVLAKMPFVDPNRIYTAGHSSAATLALLAAANDPRIQGVVAYAPCTDVQKRLIEATDALNSVIFGYKSFIARSSPKNNTKTLNCPVFLFHAEDDSNVPVTETLVFAEQLKRTNPKVTLVRVPTGNHYNSMIRQGIPAGIQWLKGLKP